MKGEGVRSVPPAASTAPAAFLIAVVLASVAATRPARGAVIFGQVDDFQNGSTMGWDEGGPSPNPPTNAPGGPDGAADRFLRNVSSGGSRAGSRMAMFNQDQWAGDYNAAGVTRITGWVANLGTSELHVRLALAGGGSRFGSTRAYTLPPGSGWRRVSFDLTESGMAALGGGTLSTALSRVTELRLLTARNGPAFIGDDMDGVLGVDDLRAMRPEGDANFDGRVNAIDLRVVRSNLGRRSGATWAQGDFNFDGRVNGWDWALARQNFGAVGTAGATVVPEPGAFLVVAAGAITLLRRR